MTRTKPTSAAAVVGVESLKTLVGAIGLHQFTVDELAEHAGVHPKTVATVIRRNSELFVRDEARSTGRQGRPSVVWSLSSEHVDELVELVSDIQEKLGPIAVHNNPDPDRVDPSLVLAMDGVSEALTSSSSDAIELVSASRNYLFAAGFDADGSPWGDSASTMNQARARVIAHTADLVEAVHTGDQLRIEKAQLLAIPAVKAASPHISAADWLPVAQGIVRVDSTALASAVVVGTAYRHYMDETFPSLVTCEIPVRGTFECLQDSRVERALHAPIPIVYEPDDWNVGALQAFVGGESSCSVVAVGEKAERFAVANHLNHTLVYDTDPPDLEKRIARAVNGIALGLTA